ncbi:endothelin-converting enzyme 1-like [Dermacentor variabilis]|uniref:endothelin-converting enzyme 1-like n=1 Tax=Dermacentor variabilis TaxID=34621 RepID=UPI003F5B7DF4
MSACFQAANGPQCESPASEEELSSQDKSETDTESSSQPSEESAAPEATPTAAPSAAEDIHVRKRLCNWTAVCWEAAIFLFAFLLGSVVITTFVWVATPNAPSLLLALWSTARPNIQAAPTTTGEGVEAFDAAAPWGPCASAACLEQSRLLLRQLNGTVDPCDDFYEHVCRNWAQAHPLQPGQAGVSVDDVMLEIYSNTLITAIRDDRAGFANLCRFFNECLVPDERLYYELMGLLQRSVGLSGWNTTASSRMGAAQLSQALGAMQRHLAIDVIFRLTKVEAASGNGTLLIIQQPTTVLVRSKQSAQEEQLSRQYFEPLLAYFRRSFKTDVFILEKRLANFFRRREDDNFDKCPTLQVSQLPVMQRIEWLSLLRTAFGDDNISKSTPVVLGAPEYVFGLAVEDALPSSRELVHYMLFRLAILLLPLNSDSRVRDSFGSVGYASFPEIHRPLRQTKACLRILNRFESNIPLYLSRGYSESVLGGRTFIQWLLARLRDVFRDHVLRIHSFSNALRGRLVTGLDAIAWEPLFPTMLLNDSVRVQYAREAYQNSSVSTSSTMHQWLTNSSHRRFPWSWRGGFLSSEPRLSYPYRRLEIPPATFSLNVYNDTTTGALQIARIGPRIYSRLFDVLHSWTLAYDQGRRHQRKFVRSFASARSCLAQDYDRMSWLRKTPSPGNGSWPLQDLWDGLAVPLAYEAFLLYLRKTDTVLRMGASKKDFLDAPRLFFVYYASSLCENVTPRLVRWNAANGLKSPAWFRVNGPLRNTPQFAEAFRCRAKTFMNPARKCLPSGLN